MSFEWDENKRQSNIDKHGIDFADAVKIFDTFVHTVPNDKVDYGEQRMISVGILEEREITVIHTQRGDNIRIISARRARVKEREIYHEEAEKNGDRFRTAGRNEG